MIYDTKYGATFGYANAGDPASYHSMRDFGLYPRGKPIIAAPTIKKQATDVPGMDGELDFTESLDGTVHYNNREGTFPYVYLGSRTQWDAVYHRVLAALHGKKMAVVLDEDNGGYYYGRFAVQPPQYDRLGREMYITITAELDPWFYDPYSTILPWVWDTFNFETGIIRDYSAIDINSASEAVPYTLIGSQRPVCPVFRLTSGTALQMTYTSVDGTSVSKTMTTGANYQYDDFILHDGENTIALQGVGTLQIEYRGGCL